MLTATASSTRPTSSSATAAERFRRAVRRELDGFSAGFAATRPYAVTIAGCLCLAATAVLALSTR